MNRSYPRFHARNVISPVPALDNLVMRDMPDPCSVAVKLAVRVGRQIILVGDDGTIFWPDLSPFKRESGGVSYAAGVWPWTNDLMEALCKAGVITEEQRAVHVNRMAEIEAEKSRKFNEEQLRHHAGALGISADAMLAERKGGAA